MQREDLAKTYKKVMNLNTQINLNIAFDEILERVLTEKINAPIQVVCGMVRANYNPENNEYTFVIRKG